MPEKKNAEMASDEMVVQSILELSERIKKAPGATMTLSDVIGVAELLAGSLQPLLRRIDTTLQQELRGILTKIVTLRAEISKVHADDISSNRIPEVGKELSEVVLATESATNSIMGAAEAVLAAEESDEASYRQMVSDQMMVIFEACSFQDITGQRINKVVETIEVIEERINILCEMMDDQQRTGEVVLTESEKARQEALLTGPTSNGVDQSAIDAMF
ncbi:MAG TPA: chemotaxis protein [Devosia sp.]|nr:chemotaxis protein [Devosia sp.]